MDNKEKYKKAIDQIHASDDLKEKAFQKAKNVKSTKYNFIKYLSTCAAILVLFFVGINYVNDNGNGNIIDKNISVAEKNKEIDKEIIIANAKLPRFESMEQLQSVLKEKNNVNKEIMKHDIAIMKSAVASDTVESSSKSTSTNDLRDTISNDFSNTNTQVQNVDEADIVKTDGEYIYYVSNNKIYIVNAENLDIISEIQVITESERFNISEIYLKDNKLIVIGNGYILKETNVISSEETRPNTTYARANTTQVSKAIVYNIENKSTPKIIREVALDGNYIDSRMIEDNLYFISRKYAYFYIDAPEYDILPIFEDSALGNYTKRVDCTDIIYFEGTEDTSFMMVGGFNINNKEEVCVETFFGAGNIVYANEENLYLTQQVYTEEYKTTIYKFGLEFGKIKLLAKGEVKGKLNNQFSMDEYDGNLRVATTSYITIEPQKEEIFESESTKPSLPKRVNTNNLFVLDEKLKEIGKIENLAQDEKIYSVRFIGKIGYIVTFKQVDPLFVIDLSNPTNPIVKGELKIPGYSSYLHPYDENHIIGIGYNTKDNGHGGVTNANMKMSMFDVSDLENPKEIFNVDIGDDYAYSEIINNHKTLFYKKSENLIGFPVTYRDYDYRNDKNGFIIFRIDIENNQFEKYGEILNKINYKTNVKRVIYIKDVLYTLSNTQIVSYDLNTFEKLNEVELNRNDINEEIIYDTIIE